MRFVMISFLFMGWAFYEMSGGSDFDPDAIKAARLAEAEAEAAQQDRATVPSRETAAATPAVVLARAPEVSTASEDPEETEVTRVSLNLTTLEEVVAPAQPAPQDNAAAGSDTVPQNGPVITSSADTPAIIPSLIDPTDSGAATTTALSDATADIRTVAGNRVNVRGGPGTDFGVVGRLVRGDEIRVLEDNGAGWVRFETVDGSTDGWMADFLLSDS